MSKPLRLGTRGSALALTQSGTIADRLRAAGHTVELTIIKTAGDRDLSTTFSSIGTQGVFVREIEQALVDRRIELAVHSFKDLPTQSPSELTIAAIPERVDPSDLVLVRPAAVGKIARELVAVSRGTRIGTASARRRAWLKHFRPDLQIEPLRGNVPTRVRRVADGDFCSIVLAAAGLERLRADRELEQMLRALTVLRLDPQRFVPAPAQGALAVQCRTDNPAVLAALRELDHAPSRAAVTAERDALACAEGGCDIAFGAYCTATNGGYELIAMHERNGRVHTARVRGSDARTLGAAAWAKLAAERGDET